MGILEIEEQFAALLSAHLSSEEVSRRLFEAENRNMPIFGYGAKAFMLSMIETAVAAAASGNNYRAGVFAEVAPCNNCCTSQGRRDLTQCNS